MYRVAVCFMAALVATTVLTACNPEDTPYERSVSVFGDRACQVGVIGDSLTVGARDTGGLVPKFAKRGCQVTVVDAAVSRHASTGADIVEHWAAEGLLPRILVVALGTNDCSGPGFEVQLQRILRAAGPDRPILWVNTWRPGCDVAINGVIGNVQFKMADHGADSNMWILDHWGFIEANRGLLSRGVHLNAAGYRAHADRIVSAVMG